MTRRRAALFVGVLAALSAGCGGAESDLTPVVTTSVEMAKSYRFDPRTIEVEPGSTVTWTNDDNFTHTVQVEGGEDHEVGPGESASVTFDRAGSYHYVCTLHRLDMDGDVIVR